MKQKKNIFFGLLIAASLLLAISCDITESNDGGTDGGGATPTAVTFESAVSADGADGTANTTELTLTFSVDPTTLAAGDITVTGATKGALSGSGTTRTLAVSNITVANGETVSIAIASPSGYTIIGSPQTAVVYRLFIIGDIGPSGVGIVFYTTDGGSHGLEVAPSDQSTSQVWIAGGSTQANENGNTGTAIGTGLANSNAIIDQTGHTGSAAKICKDYNGGGFSDWFLPSKDELNAIWENLVDDGTGSNSGVGGFTGTYYWSSSEGDSDEAWGQSFGSGSQSYGPKNYGTRVRAIRAF
ncbi:MAG: DUF1566 domain-containing protein [Spirochaetes bacterium]|nr:DUF1566 domain-containing protein [Bacteroidales bacterium]MBN2772086.1 DUF1566 domain-containing protein [Spirochaetota bacterium]